MADDTLMTESSGKIVSIQGNAVAESNEGSRTLSIGSAIFQGETLSTGPDTNWWFFSWMIQPLAMGEDSLINISSYVYDTRDPSGSDLLFQMGKGVFRTVTGEIAEQNPDHFKLKSPLAHLGIRGTTVVSEVNDLTEKHGVEDIGSGKVLVVRDNMGNIQFIDSPNFIIDFFQNQAIKPARPLTPVEQNYFRSHAPIENPADDTDRDDGPENGSDPGDDGQPQSDTGGQEPVDDRR